MTTPFPTLKDAGLSVEQRADMLVAVMDSNLDAVISIDIEGRILEWSRAAEEMFLWCRAEAIGRRLDELIVPPGQVEAHRAGLARWRKTGLGAIIGRRVRVQALERCGKPFPVELVVSHWRNAERDFFTARIRDLSREAADAEQIDLQSRLLHHRRGNDLTIAIALVRDAQSLEQASERLVALGRTNDIVRAAGGKGADLVTLVEAEVATYGADRLLTDGPSVWLGGGAAQTLGVCIHEMCTNAVKHGALLYRAPPDWAIWRPLPHVEYSWQIEDGSLVMDWREVGGPAPAPPATRNRGFGSSLVARNLRTALGGAMTLDYRRTGLVAQVRIPVDKLQ